jgi:cytochrome c553
MHEEMKGGYTHGKMKKGWIMKKWMKKYLSEDDMKKIALMKLDMKVARAEQKLEYLKTIRDMMKEKM